MNSIIYETEDRTIKVIDLRKEYTDYKEDIPYAIVTNLSEEKLKEVLGNELKQYSPYVILSRAMYKAMRNSFLNDERERLRNIKYHDAFALDAAMCLVNELADPALICESLYTMDCILNKIRELPKKVGPRVYKRYVVGFTIKEIAEQESTNIWVILKSIERAMPDIHDIFVEMEVVA